MGKNRGRAIVFSALLAVLACGQPAPPPAGSTPATHPALAERVTWMGLYLRGVKIGWSRSELKRTAPGRLRMENETRMRLKTLGVLQDNTIDFRLDFTEALEPVEFEFRLESPAAAAEASGRVENGELVTRIKTPESEREERTPLDPDLDIFGLSELRRAVAGYSVGQVIEGRMYEPMIFGVVPYRIEILDSSVVSLAGTPQVVFRVKTSAGGIESVATVTPDGEVLKSEGQMGIVMKRETEESAKNLESDGSLADLILGFSIDAGRAVADPARVRRAVLEVTGLPDTGAGGGVQRLAGSDSAGVVRVIIDLEAAPEEPAAALAAQRKPSPQIQSEDPRLVKQAREIVAGAATEREKAARLVEWVHRNLAKEMTFTIPSAVDVLATRRGDCNEHAALLCGLARAAGLPTRVAVGLAYQQGRFYYHAWNEIALAGRWIPVDATFGENPAGALRLRLATGDLKEQLAIAAAAGNLKIRIVEVSP